MLGTLAPYTEPIAVPDVFVSGLGEAEHIGGGCYRFTFYSTQRSLYGGELERVVVARLVMPIDAVAPAIFAAARAIGIGSVGQQSRHIHN